MNARSHSRHTVFSDRGNWAFALTVAAGLASFFLDGSTRFSLPVTAAVSGLGGLYIAAGTFGFTWIFNRPTLTRLFLYFALQIGLASAILYFTLSSGFTSIIILPLTSHAVVLLPRRWMIVACAAILISFTLVVGSLADNFSTSLSALLSMVAGTVFVIVFTQLALNEQIARAEVERLAVQLTEVNQKLREYAAQVDELATARERNRLAREIHDGLGHYLTVINVQIQAARAVLQNEPVRAADAMGKAGALAQEALSDVRRSVAALRASPTEDRSLPDLIRSLADETLASGIQTDFFVYGVPRQLGPQADLTLYRAAQEALTNVRKHAHASAVSITLDYLAESVKLTVQDNGVGNESAENGYGLIGVRERAQLLNGQVKVSTTKAEGFRLEIELPTQSESPQAH